MKSIKFSKYNQNQYYFYFIPLSILGVFMIFYNPFNLGIRENKIYGVIPIVIALLIMNDFFLPINKVEYNSKVIRIKINSLMKKTVTIEEINSFSFTKNTLHIELLNGEILNIDLNNIDASSKNRLENILNLKQ